MTNKQVAETFAEHDQLTGTTGRLGRSLHMFIIADTIYSYGNHFPIARKLPNKTVLFTTRGYSVTTTRHKNLVREALKSYGWRIIETSEVE